METMLVCYYNVQQRCLIEGWDHWLDNTVRVMLVPNTSLSSTRICQETNYLCDQNKVPTHCWVKNAIVCHVFYVAAGQQYYLVLSVISICHKSMTSVYFIPDPFKMNICSWVDAFLLRIQAPYVYTYHSCPPNMLLPQWVRTLWLVH